MPSSHSLCRGWKAVDWAIVLYTLYTAALIVVCRRAVPEWPFLLASSGALLATLALLPPRGAAWEKAPPGESLSRKIGREAARFLRYSYPLPLALVFFEEVRFTVNAVTPDSPYWFEPYLYAADRRLFGTLPSLAMASWVSLPLTELMHGLYFSYYFILIGSLVTAWVGPGEARRYPGPGFEPTVTAMALSFLLAFTWYPWLPARGPWENPDLMAGLPPFEGLAATALVQGTIDLGAVSGGCFPSAHVAGAWGAVFGLAVCHRRRGVALGLVAGGMSLACVYTRYHHGVDVPAGFLMALGGGGLTRLTAAVDRRRAEK